MSLFRKPKKIQSRVFCADDDDDGDPEPPPPPTISAKKEKPAKTKSLLSFADEEEDGEVFQVKKSSQSKRLAKRRDKERRRPDTDNNKFDNDNHEENPTPMEVDNDSVKPKKKITLEGLILSGREALSAEGTGDISEGSEREDEEEEDSRGFHRYRAETVRAALAGAPGAIPDAALIHAARKTRQQARELGGDYIPVKTESAPGSRLVREDGSDDDEDGRIQVRGLELPSDKPKRGTAVAANEDVDSEGEQWEAQQLQKAMPALQDITCDTELNPFALAPPAPRLHEAPPHLRSLRGAAGAPPGSAAELLAALSSRLQELRTQQQPIAQKREATATRLHNALRARDVCNAKCKQLDRNYKRAQAMRAYLTDLLECLDEKMPQLEALEGRALALHRRRCEFLVERRRADVRDQAQDVLAMAARPGTTKPAESEEKRRRCAEREGRRRARRLKRAASCPHREGDSSDDELPPQQEAAERAKREAIRQEGDKLFSDALPAWRGLRALCGVLARHRRRARGMYCDAYLPHALPGLLAPYVRQQLILWNPLADEDNEDYERMDWYKCLMMYGVRDEPGASDSSDSEPEPGLAEPGLAGPALTEAAVREDTDLMLVPTVLNKVVLPKIAELLEHAWDPLSVRASIRLRALLVRGAAQPAAAPALRRLAAAAHHALAAALSADVFLPALPPQLMEGPGGAFWRRCLGAGVRLLRATLALTAPPALLRADPIVLALIDTLSMAAGAAPGPQMALAAAALADTLPRAGSLRARALRRLAALAALASSRLHSDNPLHLKAIEQTRAVIAEAKAVNKDIV